MKNKDGVLERRSGMKEEREKEIQEESDGGEGVE